MPLGSLAACSTRSNEIHQARLSGLAVAIKEMLGLEISRPIFFPICDRTDDTSLSLSDRQTLEDLAADDGLTSQIHHMW
ncbi:unnamed protein product [Phytophthora fragariaefolia]|uniref:Unnamed protein product n=1 Tax=Phytophthora fragariaefolia TaxID=1490495 RepID=A0A9W6YCH0_9STRA|nr:unnamed protein product [Phytophthora fragariaefolia]